jgi:hypothetical protein
LLEACLKAVLAHQFPENNAIVEKSGCQVAVTASDIVPHNSRPKGNAERNADHILVCVT